MEGPDPLGEEAPGAELPEVSSPSGGPAREAASSKEFPVGTVVRLVGLTAAEFNHHVGRVAVQLRSGRVGVALHGVVWPAGSGGERQTPRRRRETAVHGPIALKPENLRRCRLPDVPTTSVLGTAAASTIVRLLGGRGWGLQDTIAESIAEHLAIHRVTEADVSVVGCSSSREDFPLAVALNSREDEWWISGAGTMPEGRGREYLEFGLGPALRRVSFVALRIPPLPHGPLSVRDFHLEVPRGGAGGEAEAWALASACPLQTQDRMGLQEFALVPPLDARALRLVCTSNAAAACGAAQAIFRADCVGLFQVAFA